MNDIPKNQKSYFRNQLNVGADRVRILLFRECEWRGRKLLFDSYSLEGNRRTENNNEPPTICRNGGINKQRDGTPESSACEVSEGNWIFKGLLEFMLQKKFFFSFR